MARKDACTFRGRLFQGILGRPIGLLLLWRPFLAMLITFPAGDRSLDRSVNPGTVVVVLKGQVELSVDPPHSRPIILKSSNCVCAHPTSTRARPGRSCHGTMMASTIPVVFPGSMSPTLDSVILQVRPQ